MPETAQAETHSAAEVVQQAPVAQSPSGICFATFGENLLRPSEIEHMVGAVSKPIATALARRAFYFVPLALAEGDETRVAQRYDVGLSDRASCHRNYSAGNSQCTFISTRVLDDKFSVAFEFFINVGHNFVEEAGVSEDFANLVWEQAQANVKGESSLDAYELRRAALAETGDREKARHDFGEAAFSDAIAIYLLSLFIDFDYYDLRERDYPLLAPQAIAERLRKVNELFPANPGYEFAINYRRK